MQLLTGWLLIILSVVGYTEWWVIVVNRSHGLPINPSKLRKFRLFHEIMAVVYPFLLCGLIGFGPGSLLRGGSFSEQSPMVQWLLGGTIAGCIPLILGIIRWNWLRRRTFHHADKRQRHDVLNMAPTESARKEVKGPRRHYLRCWPWNEIFHLEVNTKSVRLPRRAAAELTRPALRVVHLSDLHFIGCPGEAYFRFVVSQAASTQADMFVFTGDLIDDMDLLSLAVDTLQPLTSLAPCYFILGNHDWRFEAEKIRDALSLSGWRCITGSHDIVRVGDRQVLIAGLERPWMGGVPPAVRDAGCDVRILLSHTPDQYRFAQKGGYDLMLSGHNHGGQVVLPLIGPVYSPSVYGVSFASGLMTLGELVVHVSRGVGAKDPLRWRCSPELTCLDIYC